MNSLNWPTDAMAPTLPDARDVEAVAVFDEHGFESGRDYIADFTEYLCYEDWLDARYGLTMGLCASGVDARMVPVDLAHFLVWCRTCGLEPSEAALDAFAGVVGIVRDGFHGAAATTALAMVSEAEFSKYSHLVDAFRADSDHAAWTARREAGAQPALAAGKVVLRAPTRVDAFLEWTRCLDAESSEALLDRYAALTLEALAYEYS